MASKFEICCDKHDVEELAWVYFECTNFGDLNDSLKPDVAFRISQLE